MVILKDKAVIESFLRQNTVLHLYELGDLDDFFFPYTAWYALEQKGMISALALLYTGTELPVLLALDDSGSAAMPGLLDELKDKIPKRFYCHLTPGLESSMEDRFLIEPHGTHYKMTLTGSSKLGDIDSTGAIQLDARDKDEILDFYASAYPGNWFDARMLETGQYFGLRQKGRLTSIAGIHVYSPKYKVVALGNIATLPEFRGQGLGTIVTAALCRNLLKTVDIIGLNVKTDNADAIRCYQKLGFEITAEYNEFMANERIL
ncbi:GNAT family N-acetyltransferase [candidate division TA06 bacterium]|nr:GNAT family N-acetyltransferase [candidate division TA06 bacterium]